MQCKNQFPWGAPANKQRNREGAVDPPISVGEAGPIGHYHFVIQGRDRSLN